MFGRAAPTMKRYYDRLERAWNTSRRGRTGWGHSSLIVNARSMSVEDVEACERLLAEARQAAHSDVVASRIDIVAAGLAFGSYPIRIAALADEIGSTSIDSRASAQAALDKIGEINRLAAKRVTSWKAIRARKDLAGETFNALAKYSRGRKFAQADGLASAAAAALPRVLQWFSKDEPGRLAAVAAQLRALKGPLGEISRAWLFVREHQPKNLLSNGDFEADGPNRAKAEKDWSTTNAPPGWSTWSTSSHAARFVLAAGKGVDRSNAVGISEATSACFLQSVRVKPGERYLCCVSARRTPVAGQGDVLLRIRWRRSDGRWLEPSTAEGSVALSASAAGFEPLMLLMTVPPGAGKLNLQLGARNQDEGVTAWFDNAGAYRLED